MEILICDDDPNQRDSIRVCLEVSATPNNFTEFELGQDAIDHLRTNDVDLVFLDMGLPDIAGLDVLREITAITKTPVIVVSGNDTTESVAQALTIGADDYVTKPFIPMELIARVEAVTRRAAGREAERTVFSINDLTLDFDRKTALDGNQKLDLNLTEWDILKSLLSDPGVVVEYSTLKQEGWGSDAVSDAAAHMAIRRLRQKLNLDVTDQEGDGIIRSHRGIGYSISIGSTE